MAKLTIQEQVIARSLKDPAFRQQLLSNPKQILAREYNIQLPEEVTVRVLEDAPDTLSVVLPPQLEAVQELSESDLEAVAGGIDIVITNTKWCHSF